MIKLLAGKFLLVFFAILWLPFILFAGQDWGVPIMPLSEVKPGMKGFGKTVFYGTEIDTFGVKIIQVVKNFYPKRDIILARLTGKKARYAGVVSGMSGSPIYIKGKLVGALAYRFGQFMKEPIAGIMPFASMMEAAQKEQNRNKERIQHASLLPEYLSTYLVGADEMFWQNILSTFSDRTSLTHPALVKIQSPLVFSGFSDRIISQYQDIFSSMGFETMPGGSQPASDKTGIADIQPGAAIAQVFIHGDMGIEATGTVTAVKEDDLLAFGHFVFNLGAINLPMARTRIIATLPSYMGSSKMAVASDIVGSFRQDRLSGVFGKLNTPPKLIPVHLKHISATDGVHEYHFSMASDPALNNLIPFYLRIALIQGLTAARLSAGESTLHLKGKILLDNDEQLPLDDFFSSQRQLGFFAPGNDATAASDLVAAITGVLMVNDFNPPDIKSIDLTAEVTPGEKIARIYTIWQDKVEVKPGDDLTLNIHLKATGGKDKKLLRTFHIPQKLKANSLSIYVSSATSLTKYEMRVNPQKFQPVNFDNLLSILEKRRKNNNLYIQIRAKDSGMLLEGEELSDLPPSILGVMDSRRSSGGAQRLRDRVILEDVIPTEFYIAGAKRLSVRVVQPQKARKPEQQKENKLDIIFW